MKKKKENFKKTILAIRRQMDDHLSERYNYHTQEIRNISIQLEENKKCIKEHVQAVDGWDEEKLTRNIEHVNELIEVRKVQGFPAPDISKEEIPRNYQIKIKST